MNVDTRYWGDNMIRKFVYYNYFESDTFASYLHEMSLQGYHFKGFGFGLKFEKGEPKDIVYDAYVFNKQKEGDQGLNPNSEDFLGYCKEAGWQFIDANQRWIIFYKVREDAVDIATKEEKLDNALAVRKDDLKLSAIILALVAGDIIHTVLLRHDIFNFLDYKNLTLEFGWLLCILMPFFQYFYDRKIYQTLRSKYESTGELYLGNPAKKQMYFQPQALVYLICTIFISIVFLKSYCGLLISIVIGVAIHWVLFLLQRYFNRHYSLAGTMAVMGIIVFIFYVMMIVLYRDEQVSLKAASTDSFPLQLVDIDADNKGITHGAFTEQKGLFVEWTEYVIAQGDAAQEVLSYTLYHSSSPWLLHKQYLYLSSGMKATDVNAFWKQKSAIAYKEFDDYVYVVDCGNQLIELKYSQELTQQQINTILRKLVN